ncbi:chitobiase/beta-hexosaminidase C-terminal domain-containing protein, partial [Desulfobacterales bacterium HSG2]|nr:chitobiase/beta-hexosaminidase C-terminal domain-containing protein [Desulfobacterales bacterium HSG2]
SSPVYRTSLSVSSSMTIKARAFKSGWADSSMSAGVYTITGTVVAPSFSPPPGTYPSAQSVELSCDTPGATIRYTTDNGEPTESSPAYTTPVSVASSMTIKAKVFKSGWADSATATGVYTITGTVAVPYFSPVPGTYPSAQSVELSCDTSDAVIHYTTDGNEPDESSPAYMTSVFVSSSMTIKARAFKSGWAASSTATGVYTITGTVAAPYFSPAPGTYPAAQSVALSCDTSGAVIHYTTDGSEPDESSPVYRTSLSVSSSMTIKAKAFKSGWADSSMSAGVYTITGTVVAPSFSPPPGTYPSAQSVELSCDTPGATIRYTTDNGEPTETSPAYKTPVSVSSSMTIKAKAFRDGWADSATATGVYTITGTVAVPYFSPVPGTYPSAQSVELSCDTSDAVIHYTTDGSEPDESSPAYMTPVSVSSSMTINARAFKSGWADSSTATGVYTITGTVAAPSFSPPPGTYPAGQSVALSCDTFGATIRYTTDGSEPDESSPAYMTPVSVSSSMTINARAFKSGWSASATATGVYTITGTVAVPYFSPAPGTYPAAQSVDLSCDTSGAVIHYTTDGSEPDESSPVYQTPLSVSSGMTINAKAFKSGWAASATATGVYTITGTVAAPSFSPAPGTYPAAQSVELSCDTFDAVIHYTTDGSEPDESSPVYRTSLSVSSSTTINARAFKSGWADSATTTGIYTITGTIAAPSFFPVPGTYLAAQDIELSCDTSGAVIHYTTDGNDPDESSPAYMTPVFVSSGMTIKARAFKSGWAASPVTIGVYTITGTVAAPSFSPASGTYTAAQSVELYSASPEAVIHYTTDGSEPDEDSPAYSSPISVYETTVIKAKAFQTDWTPSTTVTRIYTITGTAETPSFSPAPATYTTPQTVELSCPSSGASIYYTTDGSEPGEHSRLYTAPVSVSHTTTIRAKAFKSDWEPSATATGIYTITETVEPPVFSSDPGIYITPPEIELSCPTPDADIYYTTDDSEPTEDSLLYSSPISVSETATIKARAFKTDWIPSAITTAAYTITGTVETPVFSPASDMYMTAQEIELTCPTPGAVIHCTTDGSEPDEDSPICSSPISVSVTMTIRAKAFKTDWEPSAIGTGNYIITSVESPESGGGGCFVDTLLYH